MFYRFLRVFARFSFKIFFRRIYTANVHKVPKDKPTIICCNHPNGFMEPCLLACFLPVPLYFLVRGDLFSVWWLKTLLKATHQIPIFRFRDGGFGKLRSNASTFDYCFNILYERKHILIFPEGSTEQERFIRPLQKGPARLAFGTVAKYPDLDLQICPVSIHFTHPSRFRSEVMIDIGDPIAINDYVTSSKEDQNMAIQDLTDTIHRSMKSISVDTFRGKNGDLIENLIEFNFQTRTTQNFFPVHIEDEKIYKTERVLLNKVDAMDDSESLLLTKNLSEIELLLGKLKLKPYALKQERKSVLPRLLFIVAGFLPALLGLSLNFITPIIGKRIADKRVKHIEFYSSVLLATSMFVYLIIWILLLVSGLIFFKWYGLFIFLVPILGVFLISWWETWQKFNTQRKWIKLEESDKENIRSKFLKLNQIIQAN